jgi:serine/threonine protein kinase/tetratricopeptide (TPR) repeat protein
VPDECPRCHAPCSGTQRFCGSCGAPLAASGDDGPATAETLSPGPTPAPGVVLAGRYRILGELGRGGMGIVYKAQDDRLKRTVALKFLPQDRARDLAARRRFLREARAAAALDHPAICAVHEIEEAAGQVFIAMAYVEGESLKGKILAGPTRVTEAVDVALQVAEGLREAHCQGVVHRDIKPGNVMVTPRGQVKIMDFGLAKLAEGDDLTGADAVLGTAAYMSPEQARGEAVDHRTDIWSLGCLVYEMLEGRRLFPGADARATLQAILIDEPVPLALSRDVPPGLQSTLRTCLQKDPRHRYPRMDDLIEDLRALAGEKDHPTHPKARPPSIAVLPFANLSGEPENEYFSDGLSEEIIGALVRVPGLRVVARTSSFAFKGEKVDARDVGRRLGVDTLLEGSVRRSGPHLRVTAQLIDVSDGCHLWSERFDREMENVFAIQDEISARIVEKVGASPLEGGALAAKETPANLEAYDLYLRGRYLAKKFDFEPALPLLQQAVEKDPGLAPAWAALAELYVHLSTGFDVLPSREAMPKAREAAQTALRLDPSRADAHVALGLVATCYDWDRHAARHHFDRALALNPGMASAYQWSEYMLSFLERDYDAATAALERAQDLDPLNVWVKVRLAFVDWYRGENERAIAQLQRIEELEPGLWIVHSGLQLAYFHAGRTTEALAAGEKALALGGDHVAAHLGAYGAVCAAAGHTDKARESLARLEERAARGHISSFWIAGLHASLGDLDLAFEWLDKAVAERDGGLIFLTITVSLFSSLRADPRYAKLLRKMGLDHLVVRG